MTTAPSIFGTPPGRTILRRPVVIQSATGSTTLTLGQTPRPGSLLVVGAGSIQAADFTVTGGGATWTRIARNPYLGGAQVECQLWTGIVGSSPSTSISVPYTNSGSSMGVELQAGWQGQCRAHMAVVGGPGGTWNLDRQIGPLSVFFPALPTIYYYYFFARGSGTVGPTRGSGKSWDIAITGPSWSGLGFALHTPGVEDYATFGNSTSTQVGMFGILS